MEARRWPHVGRAEHMSSSPPAAVTRRTASAWDSEGPESPSAKVVA